MIRQSSQQRWDRLSRKNLDTQFIHEMIHGLNCSPYEASAMLESVYKIYAPAFATSGALLPGQILFQVLAAENAASVPVAESKQMTVTLTLDDSQEDLAIRKRSGVVGLRRHRIQRVCVEAFQQGGILTVEDLAYRLFNCGQRTICRDLAALRRDHIAVPLRSTVTDIGRTLSHRAVIVREWLKGKEYSEIARGTYHSIASVKNYIEKFKRVILLAAEGYDVQSIGFLVRISPALAEEYARLQRQNPMVRHRKRELAAFVKKNRCSWKREP